MSSAVTKAGPYFASGEIKWSSLRDTFRLGTPSDDGATPGSSTTGTISASELRRDADVTETNPIVPDATENASLEGMFAFMTPVITSTDGLCVATTK